MWSMMDSSLFIYACVKVDKVTGGLSGKFLNHKLFEACVCCIFLALEYCYFTDMLAAGVLRDF